MMTFDADKDLMEKDKGGGGGNKCVHYAIWCYSIISIIKKRL